MLNQCVAQRLRELVANSKGPSERHGQHQLGIHDDPAVTKGYPIIQASVSSPESRMYAAIYGWVQITYTPGEDWVMDLYPPFQDVNSPYTFCGAEPTLVEFP